MSVKLLQHFINIIMNHSGTYCVGLWAYLQELNLEGNKNEEMGCKGTIYLNCVIEVYGVCPETVQQLLI